MSAFTQRTDFPDGCAVVIGGSGGIGSVAAARFSAHGVPVLVTFQGRAEKAENVVSAIERNGGTAAAQRCDVSDRASVVDAFAHARTAFGRVHSIVCAQGRSYRSGAIAEADPDDLRRKFETDVVGFLNIMQTSLPHMREHGGGTVTAIVSPTIQRFVAGYGMAMTPKAGLAGMIRYFAAEEGPNNVRVNAIAPGVIDAGMALDLLDERVRGAIERAVASTPLRRRGLPEEVAELLFFLASSKSGFITGQVINIDGGFSL
jgi:NAD(P)-dependent dehydrogenase (short-subunit alcohol dehydrogenase family)